jgi:hypothetical protein
VRRAAALALVLVSSCARAGIVHGAPGERGDAPRPGCVFLYVGWGESEPPRPVYRCAHTARRGT